MRRKTSTSGTLQQDDCGAVSAISFDAAMETTSSEHDLSPQTKYCIDIDLTLTPMERSELSTSNSPSKFFCRFDPVARKGRLLMLLFDRQGNSTLQEMSRMDVLRMTQEAARLQDESPAKVSSFRQPGKTSPRRRRSGLQQVQAPVDGGHPPGCDVQVRLATGYCSLVNCLSDLRMIFFSAFIREIFAGWRTRSRYPTSRRSSFASKRSSSALVRLDGTFTIPIEYC